MNYHGLVKRLDLPAGWVPPAELEHDDIRARAISRADNDDDVQGINASIELIRRTRGGRWPTEPVSVDYNFVDEVWHECAHCPVHTDYAPDAAGPTGLTRLRKG